MGQYYKAVILGAKSGIKGYFRPHRYGTGAKLVEHSYIGNNFVDGVMCFLYENTNRLVWAGDYADAEKGGEFNLYELCDGIKDENGNVIKKEKKELTTERSGEPRFIINEDKHEFIDLWYVRGLGDLYINPLPILTAEGNGRGMGDYKGTNMNLVGTWARDNINTSNSSPVGNSFKEINPLFVREYTIKNAIDTLTEAYSNLKEEGGISDALKASFKELKNSLR